MPLGWSSETSSFEFETLKRDSIQELLDFNDWRLEVLIKMVKLYIEEGTLPVSGGSYEQPNGFWEVLDLFRMTNALWIKKKQGL